MKKKILLLLCMIGSAAAAMACPACEKQQPKLLKGISHGVGPQSKWDYVIVIAVALIVVATLYYSIKWIIKPGEKSATHIKRTILNFE